MNKQNLIFNIFFITVLILIWTGILFVSFLLYLMSDIFKFLGNGVLIYSTLFIYALAFVLPIVFRKRISKYLPLPVSCIVFTIFSIVIVGCILVGARNYISNFSQEKWNDNDRLRIYMIGNLEEREKIIGKTNAEIIDLLGKPTYIRNTPNIKYEYYVGERIIDPLGYQIEFENNIAINTELIEH